jgi:hypothetical protein
MSASTRDDLVRTIAELLADSQQNRDRDEWENPTLDRFLEAMGAWVDDYGRITMWSNQPGTL